LFHEVVNRIQALLNIVDWSKTARSKFNQIINSQLELETTVPVTPEEELVIKLMIKQNEKILLEHIRKTLEGQDAN